jgi:hypothetical protein
MTANSDGAKPNPGDQQQPDPAAVAAAALAAGQQPPTDEEPQPVDLDDKEVKDAIAAAEAEKAAAGGGDGTQVDPANPQGQPKSGEQQDQQPQGGGQQQQPAGEQVMIPKARLDEALAKGDEKAAEAAYWKGRADALAQGQQPPKNGQQQPSGQQQQQPTAEARLAEIQAQSDALAAKFDNGEITMADLTKQQRDLTNKEAAIREEILLAKVRPAQAQPADQGSDQLYLDTLTAQLEQEHPWVGVFDKVGSDTDWNYLKATAIDNLTARGIDPTKGNLGRYELRKEIATLADQLGPSLVAAKATAKGIAIPGQTPSPGGQQQQKPRLSPQAQARDAKLGKAENAPPNINAMNGNAGEMDGLPSEARLETMSDDDIGNLPANVRSRLLGTQA